MTTKQDAQFLFEDCSCMEMMSQMMSHYMGQEGVGNACAEMLSRFADPQGSGTECFEMMSQMMASCRGIQQEEDKIIKDV